MHEAITKQLLDIMEHGMVDVDRDGNVLKNEDDSVKRIPPTAACIAQAIRWHAELKKGNEDQSPMEAAMAAARAAAEAALPPMSDGDDSATR